MNALTLTDTDWQLAGEIARLEVEAADTEEMLTASKAAVARHLADIRERFAAEIAEVQAANDALVAFMAKRQERERVAQEAFKRWAGADPGAGPQFQHEPVKPNRNARRKAKKLYLAIALRCHPDKTEDPDLHAIYLAAQGALAADDVVALEQLLATAKEGARHGGSAYDARRARVRARRKALAARAAELQGELEALQRSQAYADWLACGRRLEEVGREQVDAEYRRAFAQQRDAFKARLAQLTAPQPAGWVTMFGGFEVVAMWLRH